MRKKDMVRRFLVATCIGLAALAAGGVAAAQPDRHAASPLLVELAREIEGYANYTVFDHVEAAFEDGLVTLTGKVTSTTKREELEQRVQQLSGVTRVDNRIGVLAASASDDELRHRISRAIYGNPSFWQYASMVHPPIHIIVDGGHVTLTGVVQSTVDRMMARSLASSAGALSVRNELKTAAESRAALERAGW